MIGVITADPVVARVKNSDSKALFVQVRFSLDGDIREVQYMPGVGEDTVPVKGDIVAVERFGGILIATASKDTGESKRKPGEREFYSRDAGGKKAGILVLENNGEADLSSNVPAGKQAGLSLGKAGAVLASMAAGSNAAALALKPSGLQYQGNVLAGQDMFTVMNTFMTQFSTYTATLIQALTTATTGSPPPTVDPGALAAFATILGVATTLQTAIATMQSQWAMIFDPTPPTGGAA
jgi:hypothetical protein